MKYSLVNCAIKETQGENTRSFLTTTAVSERSNDNGFKLPMFNPAFIAAARQCIEQGLDIDKYITEYFEQQGAEIEERTVQLKQVYMRKREDGNGNFLNEPVLDDQTRKPKLYSSLKIHCIFTRPTEPAYYVSGEKAGMRIMEQDFRPDGTPYMRPAVKFVLDESGRPKKEYWEGWSAIERRDQILSMFYMLAPAEYQVATGAEAPQSTVQPQEQAAGRQEPANPFANTNVAPQAGQQPQQQPQVDPLNS